MQNEAPLVSLIIISFNAKDTIGDCLNALLKQTYPNYEILVFDNASTDGTPDFIEANFQRVKVIRCAENLGFGGANNEAARAARGRYLGFVNDDAFVTPGWLEPLVNLLETDASIGCAGPELLCSENHELVLCHGNGIHLSGIAYLKDRGRIASSGPPLEVGGISGAAFLINRDLFLGMGGFESLFFLYYEDTDLSLRLRLMGKRCVVTPEARVYHNSQSRFASNKVFFLERNRYLSIFTLLSPAMLGLMFPSILIFELFAWGYCILRGKEVFLTKIKAWKSIHEYRHWMKVRRGEYRQFNVSLPYLLGAFSPKINLEYVHSSRFLGFFASLVGYVVAVPIFYWMNGLKKFKPDPAAQPLKRPDGGIH